MTAFRHRKLLAHSDNYEGFGEFETVWLARPGRNEVVCGDFYGDPECALAGAVNGTGPQMLDFEAVIWGPRRGQIRQLRPLPGDSVGMALGINDKGQAVGSTGSCANTSIPPSRSCRAAE